MLNSSDEDIKIKYERLSMIEEKMKKTPHCSCNGGVFLPLFQSERIYCTRRLLQSANQPPLFNVSHPEVQMSIHLYKHNEDAYRAVETRWRKSRWQTRHPSDRHVGKSMIASSSWSSIRTSTFMAITR